MDAVVLMCRIKKAGCWPAVTWSISSCIFLQRHKTLPNSDIIFCCRLVLGQSPALSSDVYGFPYKLSDKICISFCLSYSRLISLSSYKVLSMWSAEERRWMLPPWWNGGKGRAYLLNFGKSLPEAERNICVKEEGEVLQWTHKWI